MTVKSGVHLGVTFIVPDELAVADQWVCWRFEERDGKKTKVPIDARDGRGASATNPATWTSLQTAVEAWQARGYDGVGFVFAADGPFAGVDLDDCIDDEGKLAPAAADIVGLLNSYSEISPSGHGLKIYLCGRKPPGAGCRTKAVEGFKEIEVYDRGRFFCFTGRQWPGSPTTVEARQHELDELCSRFWPDAPKPAPARPSPTPVVGFDDDQLLAKAMAAKNGDAIRRLFEGRTSDHGDDDSAADLALCSHLAFWTGCDAQQIDALFRRSGLMRAKWDESRGATTYGRTTIDRAISGCREAYTPPGSRSNHGDRSSGGSERSGGDGLESLDALGQRDAAAGKLVLSPRSTLPTAEAFVRERHTVDGVRTILSQCSVFLCWRNNRYEMLEDDELRHAIHPWLHDALRVSRERNGEMRLLPFEANPTTVNAALDTIRSLTHIGASVASPSWLEQRPEDPPAVEVLPCRTLNVHVPTGTVLPSTPRLFTTSALEFDFDAEAPEPRAWHGFLGELFDDDVDSLDCLQEWFGYCLVADTSLQKMLLLVGPRRSGKGTIGRVLTRLVGAGNVAGPTTGGLAGPFGLQPLLGKSLAIVSDARFSGDSTAIVAERLLCISGEDSLTVDRKFLGAVTVKLPTRLMFLTNELPRLSDASNALAGRFVVLRLERSFYGEEDIGLLPRLEAELPGILLWALEGLRRLRARGRFNQPPAGADTIETLEELGSPITAFVKECCSLGPNHRVDIDELYRVYVAWCDSEGRAHPHTKAGLGRDLRAAFPQVQRRRGTGQKSFYEGIGLPGGQS